MSAKRPQTAFLLLFLVSFLGDAGLTAPPPDADRVTATGGVEYQVISQRYYQSVIDTSTLDPIEIWQSARDEINEMIVRSALGYHHRRAHTTLDLTGAVDLSPSRFLSAGELTYVRGGRDNRLAFFGRFENRSPLESETDHRDGYNHVRTTLSGAKRLSSLFRLTARTGYEQISYQENRPASDDQPALFYLYDYSLLSGEVGSDIGRWFSTRMIYSHRRVPDSASAGYDNYRYDMELTHFGLSHGLTVAGEIELKEYFHPGGRNDFWAGHLAANLWKDIGSQVEAGFRGTFHGYHYRRQDLSNRDYQMGLIELKATRPLVGLDLGPLARYEFRIENAADGISDDYDQWETGLVFGVSGWSGFFLDGEIAFGARLYRDEQEGISSYDLVSASLAAAGTIWRNLSATAIVDGVFERHGRDEDDVDYLLSSIGLSVRF